MTNPDVDIAGTGMIIKSRQNANEPATMPSYHIGDFFDGTGSIIQQKAELQAFQRIRKKYLIYRD